MEGFFFSEMFWFEAHQMLLVSEYSENIQK